MIASNILCNSVSRFLSTAYFNDISVSGTASLTSLSTSGDIVAGGDLYSNTGNIYLHNNRLAMYGTSGDNWLRINARTGSNFTSGVYFGSSIVRTDGTLQVGTSGAYLNSNSTNTTIANLITPIAAITTLNADNVSVSNNLHATHFDLQTVAQLGGSFYVSPTIKFPNSGTTLTVAKSGTTLTLTITDSSITSDTMAGIVWTANSKVKVSGTINGVVTGTMDGTIGGINTSSHTLTLSVSGENSGSVVAGSYSATQFSDLSVMVYQRKQDGNDYRVGIWMNCYDLETNLASIRLYGGTTAKPSVMIGNLSQANLDAVGGVNPSGWSLYADNAFLKGTIVSQEGQIGGFTIGSDTLKNGDLGATNSVVMSVGTSGTANIAGSGSISGWAFTASDKFGVTKGGDLYTTSGKIAGWTIKDTYLASGTATGPANNVLLLSPNGTTSSYKVGGLETGITGWTITSGTHFGVTKTGALYADSANITGTITANAGEIGGCSITNGVLYVTDANISGQISANHIDASSLSVGQSQVTGLSDALNGKASATDLTALTNKVNAVYGTSSTGKTTGTKVVTCSGFELYDGALITVKFSVQNTASTVKLNVNSKGEKSVWVGNAVVSSTNLLMWGAGAVITFRYDATDEKFIVIDNPKTWYGKCITAGNVKEKTDIVNDAPTIPGCVICKGTIVNLQMGDTNNDATNTVDNPTLNIASTSAKIITSNSANLTATSVTNWVNRSVVAFIFDGSGWRYDSDASIKADNASKTATNYLYFDSTNGLVISRTGAVATGYNTQITSSGMNIRNGSTVLATYGSTITLGQTSGYHTTIDSSTFSVYNNTTPLATFGSTITLGNPNTNTDASAQISGSQFNLGIGSNSIFYVGAVENPSSGNNGFVQILFENSSLLSDTVSIDGTTYYLIGTISMNAIVTKVTGSNGNVDFTTVVSGSNQKIYSPEGLSGSYEYFDYGSIYMSFGVDNYSSTNIPGFYSITSGYNNNVFGDYSIGVGKNNTISGIASIGVGDQNTISSNYSISAGAYNRVTKDRSVSLGSANQSTGSPSFSIGNSNKATGDNSVAIGRLNIASGDGAFAMGRGYSPLVQNEASGIASVAIGAGLIANGSHQTVIGSCNIPDTTSAFIIGNEIVTDNTMPNSINRSNALTVDWNGNMVLAGNLTCNNEPVPTTMYTSNSDTLSLTEITLSGATGTVEAFKIGKMLLIKFNLGSASISQTYTWTNIFNISMTDLGITTGVNESSDFAYISNGGPAYSNPMAAVYTPGCNSADAYLTVQIQVNTAVSSKFIRGILVAVIK